MVEGGSGPRDVFGTEGNSRMARSDGCYGLDSGSCGFLEKSSW